MIDPGQAADIQRTLTVILDSDGFANAPKLQRFLRFAVERTLEGKEAEIKEAVIGLEVYQKSAGYDPRLDATVRVEATKIRHRLDTFYSSEIGRALPVRISIPKGSYVPSFEFLPPPGVAVSAQSAPVRKPWGHRYQGLVLTAVLAGLVVGWLGASLWPDHSAAPATSRMKPLSDFTVFAEDPAISTDGSFVIYASDENGDGIANLWRQNVDGEAPFRVTTLEQTARTPSISADGNQIVFRSETAEGILATIPVDGGPVAFLERARRGRDPRCSPVDQRVAFWIPQDEQTLDHGAVYLLDLADANSAATRLFGGFAHAFYPVWSGSGTHLLVMGTWQSQVPEREYDAWMLDLAAGSTPRKTGLLPLLSRLGYYRSTAERGKVRIGEWSDGWLYFSAPAGQGENLFRIRLAEGSEVTGEPEQVTSGAGSNNSVRISRSNRIVFRNSLVSYGLYSAAITPPSPGSDRVRRLTHELGLNMRASVDRAGRWSGWERPLGGGSGTQLWLADLQNGRGREIAAGTIPARSYVRISPDGRQVAYQVLEDTRQSIYLEPVDGSAPPRRVCGDCGVPSDWNDAGTHLLYTTGGSPNGIGLLEVRTQRNSTLLNHPSYGLHGARFLVDERGNGWMTLYADTGPRTRQIFAAPVAAFRPADYQHWITITDGAHWDLSPAWALDGGAVYFVSQRDGHRCIWVQALDRATKRPAGVPAPLYHFHSRQQTLMESVTYRGVEALRVAGDRLFFSLDSTASSIWLKE